MLYLVASYHFTQFLGKLINQTWEKIKNLVLGRILVPLVKFMTKKVYS